jgi:hypothetical protein
MDEVHFTVNHNKRGWFITELVRGIPRQTHGPFADPINRLDAMSYLISITNLE